MALASPPTHRNAFRIAIICALPLEAEMVQASFDRNWTNEGHKFYKAGGDTNAYTTGLIGDHNVVLAHMAKMGNNNAATTASGLRSSFRRLEMIFLVGICGAAPIHPETMEEVILGDCILSTAVIQYDYGRQFDSTFVRRKGLEENLSRANPETQALTSRLKIPQNKIQLTERTAFHLDRLQQIRRFDYPGPAFDRLYPASYPHKHYNIEGMCSKCYQDADGCSSDCLALKCDPVHLLRRDRLYGEGLISKPSPYVHFGRIGSANSTLRSALLRDELAKTDHILGFEMESAGIWEVLPTILVKSVCDYADSHKNKNWQPYAAASAAACLKALFEQWETTEPSPITPTIDKEWGSNDYTLAKQANDFQHQPVTTRQSQGNLAYRLKEIQNVLKTPPYEDPLTYNSSLRLDGTAMWIFEKEIYQKWLYSSDPSTTSFLWLYAGAGTGKTILCTNVINSLKSNPSLNVFHYFSSAHLGPSTDLSNIVRYWISEMARVDSSTSKTSMLTLVEDILHQYGVGRTVANADAWGMLGNLVSHLPNCVLILDGLDEYDRAVREQLLVTLKSQLAGKGVKVLIASRDESDIRMELDSGSMDHPGLSLDSLGITRDDTRSDISLLSKNLVTRKLHGKTAALRLALASTLIKKCDGMFLWIRLTSQNMHAGQTPAILQRIVDKAPAGLDSVYSAKWHSILQHSEPEAKLRAIAVLRWCTYAFEPLTVAQLAQAIAVNLEDRSNDFDNNELPENIDEGFVIQGIKGLCSSFVELRPKHFNQPLSDQPLHLIHGSVRDFLLAELPEARIQMSSTDPSIPTDSAEHLELSKVCLRYLCYNNITATNSPHQEDKTPSFYGYAKKQWHIHQAESETEDTELVQLALRFFDVENANYVDWISVIEPPKSFWDGSQASPFYYAAHLGLSSVLIEMHSQNPKRINSIGGMYGTALQATCRKSRKRAFEILLACNANIGIEAGYWGNALSASVVGGNPEITRMLLSFGADPDKNSPDKGTALCHAAKYNTVQCAAVLLEKGASPSISLYEDTPLSIAASYGSLEVAKLLLERGADVNSTNSWGDTPILWAVKLGNQELIRLLLRHGANTEGRHRKDGTPLMTAVRKRDIDNIKLLLEYGANSKVKTIHGDSLVHLALVDGTSLEMVMLLLEHSALDKLDYVNTEGRTLLQDAAFISNGEVFDYLIAQGFNPRQKDKHGNGILESCCASEKAGLLRKLLQEFSGSLRNNSDLDTWSALHWACIRGSFEVIQLLVDAGYRTSCVTTSIPHTTWTPLDVARFFGNTSLILSDGRLNQSHPWEAIRDSGLVTFDESSHSFRAILYSSLDPDLFRTPYDCRSCQMVGIMTKDLTQPINRHRTPQHLDFRILHQKASIIVSCANTRPSETICISMIFGSIQDDKTFQKLRWSIWSEE